MHIRPVAPSDFDAIFALNSEAMPAVSEMALAQIAWFAEEAPYFRVVADARHVHGFLIALPPGINYGSLNYQWFLRHYEAFLYIDRIVIGTAVRGQGWGTKLYDDLATYARPVAPRLTCEVNIRPRNDGSLRFHHRYGFVEVGTQETEGGKKEVSLLAKDLG